MEGIETDVCLTADQRLVLIHDPLLPLGTTLEGWAHERTAAEICSGRIFDRFSKPTTQAPMTLDRLLELVPATVDVQLEVKAHADPDLASRTAEAICRRLRSDPVRERIEVISFHQQACAIAAACGFRSRLVVWADYAPAALAAWARRTGVGGISVEHFLLTESLVETIRGAGLSINTGTVNRSELLERVLGFGPDAIGTDRPHELRAEAGALTDPPRYLRVS